MIPWSLITNKYQTDLFFVRHPLPGFKLRSPRPRTNELDRSAMGPAWLWDPLGYGTRLAGRFVRGESLLAALVGGWGGAGVEFPLYVAFCKNVEKTVCKLLSYDFWKESPFLLMRNFFKDFFGWKMTSYASVAAGPSIQTNIILEQIRTNVRIRFNNQYSLSNQV